MLFCLVLWPVACVDVRDVLGQKNSQKRVQGLKKRLYKPAVCRAPIQGVKMYTFGRTFGKRGEVEFP